MSGIYRKYIDKRLGDASLSIIAQANAIVEEYVRQGLDLTLRQLYYQFVSRDLMANKQSEYNRLGNIISDGRLMGLVRWDAITDRTRNLEGHRTFEKPVDALKTLSDIGDEETGKPADQWRYYRDLWADQPWRPEVWIEKEALAGVVQQICDELRIDFFACRGYNSQSEQWRAGRRFARYIQKGQRPIVFHLGDHDPSGIDMTRDNRDRLTMFAGTPVMVQRLALNYQQIEELRPPENPCKMSDSRAGGYIQMMEEHGCDDPYVSWELDALEPTYIRDLISNNADKIRDEETWADSLSQEADEIRQLREVADAWK
jgi:hypothetical protein